MYGVYKLGLVGGTYVTGETLLEGSFHQKLIIKA